MWDNTASIVVGDSVVPSVSRCLGNTHFLILVNSSSVYGRLLGSTTASILKVSSSIRGGVRRGLSVGVYDDTM